MEIIDFAFLKETQSILSDKDVVAVGLNFKEKHDNSLLSNIPTSVLFEKNALKELSHFLTAYPALSSGKFGWFGNRGVQQAKGGLTKWLRGRAIGVRKSKMYQNFN